MKNEYSIFTNDEILEMTDSDRINMVFTESEIKELDYNFDSYLVELQPESIGGTKLTFSTTGRVCYYTVGSGICEILRFGKGFEMIDKQLDSFSADELVELNSRFAHTDFVINLNSNTTGFRKAILGTGTEIWYKEFDGGIEIVNIIAPTDNRKNVGMKFDDEKLLCMAFPAVEYKQILEVLTNGAKKYKIDNWKHVDDARNRYMNGLERHFLDYKEAIQTGNSELKFDNGEGGMGTHHLANLICNAIFLMYFDNNNMK